MKSKKINIVFVLVAALVIGMFVPDAAVSASTKKNITIWRISGNKMQYHKAYVSTSYLPNCEWENIIGGGKRQSITLSSKCKFYTFNFEKMQVSKKPVSKAKFIKATYANQAEAFSSNGKKYYGGPYCIITISHGEVVKVVQQYQA